MKDGVVQQIAAPPEVYAQPTNLHVARFMGYRNVLEVDVVSEVGELSPPPGPTSISPVFASNRCPECAPPSVIRPEEIVVTDRGGENTIAGRVDNVEYSGRDALLDVVTASGTLLHVRGAVTIKRGDQVRVHVPVERTLVYPVD